MRATVPLGRVAGIPIGMHWSALVGIALLTQLLGSTVLPMLAPGAVRSAYWIAGLLAALGLIGSLLAHELAHAISAQRTGLTVRRITLWLLGGVSELADQPPDPASEVRVALVGPATSLVMGALLGVIVTLVDGLGQPALVGATLSWLATTNVVLGVFNLLPGTPLDGGRVLHGLWWRHTGSRDRATRAASASGRMLGSVLAGFGVLLTLTGRLDGLWLLLIGWFLAGTAAAERSLATTSAALAGVRAADVMSGPAEVVSGWWTVQAVIVRVGEGTLRHRRFPVVDLDSRVVGLVTLADLARCPREERATMPVGRLARPLPTERIVEPDTAVERLLRYPPSGPELSVVVDQGAVVGVISGSDVARAVELAGLTTDQPEGAR